MTGGTRGGNGRFIRTAKTAKRDAEAARLRGEGWTFQRIADHLGYANKSKARTAVLRAFAEIPYEDADAARRLDLERIDRLIDAAWAVMTRLHYAVSGGNVVYHDGTELTDDGPVLAAIDRIRALLERRAKITGYDAPAQARVEVITTGMIEAEIARLEAEVGERSRADSGPA